MKKLIFMIVGFLCSFPMFADDEYGYLTFVNSDGSTTSVALTSYDMGEEKAALEVTVSENGELVVTSPDGNTTFKLSDLSKMYFSSSDETGESTSIDIVDNGLSSSIEVFTTTGISLGTFSDYQSLKKVLHKGVYVIQKGSRTHKISIQ